MLFDQIVKYLEDVNVIVIWFEYERKMDSFVSSHEKIKKLKKKSIDINKKSVIIFLRIKKI